MIDGDFTERKNVAIPKPIKCLALCSFVHIDCSSSGDVCQTTNSRGKSREITTNIWVAFFTILNQSVLWSNFLQSYVTHNTETLTEIKE